MTEHYQERLAFRIKARNSKLLKPDALVYIKNQIELSLIQEIEVEINYNLEKGRQLASNNWQIEPLTPVEHDTAKAFLKWLQNQKTEIEQGKSLIKKSNRQNSVPKAFQELFSDPQNIVAINSALTKLKAINKTGAFILKKNQFVGFVDACTDKDCLNLIPAYPFSTLCKMFAAQYKITVSNGVISEAKDAQGFHDFKTAFAAAYK